MDPTEIVAVPVPFEKLQSFVTTTVVTLFIVDVTMQTLLSKRHGRQQTCWQQIESLCSRIILGSLLLVFAFILCGADWSRNLYLTLWTAVYMAALLVCNPLVAKNEVTPQVQASSTSKLWWSFDILGWVHRQYKDDCIGLCRVYGTVLVCIPFQVLRLLDWGGQIQRWPLPIVLGSTIGWVIGSNVGCCWLLSQRIRASESSTQTSAVGSSNYNLNLKAT
jgi:hypothetical protein